MSKPVLYMMVGIVGSGKSTAAQKISTETDAVIFSSDKLREELFGNVDEQSKNGELFQELHRRIKECLKSGKNAVYDATNISSKRRRSFLQELNKINCEKRCVIMATPYEQCLKNNASRDRKVPEEVIDRMYRSWNTPYWFEGWDDIEVVYWNGSEKSNSVWGWINTHMNYNQDNPHHVLTLGEHCWRTGSALVDNEPSKGLVKAGLLHDCGKSFVKSFTNSKGEPTNVAHYYGHENVSAYDVLFYDCGEADPLDISILVGLHMKPYYWEKDNNKKLRDKYLKLWGEDLFESVIILHEADKAAH